MMSKTVVKYLAEGMHKACEIHATEEIRDLYAAGIVPTHYDVCTALLISDEINELIRRYNCSYMGCAGFLGKYFDTLCVLEECGVDMSDYISCLFREVFRTTGISRSILCEIALVHLKPEKLELLSNCSWIKNRSIGTSLLRTTSFFECAWNYTGRGKISLNYHIFHLLTHSPVRKILDKTGIDAILCFMICGETGRDVIDPVMLGTNSMVKMFIDAVDDENLLSRFPSKRLLPGFLQQLRRCVDTVETTLAINSLVEPIVGAM